MSGTVTGVVETAEDGPLAGALVTLRPTRPGLPHRATTDRNGAVVLPLVRAGEYEASVEALGYRPVLVRTLRVTTGEVVSFRAVLAAASPPVASVDTLVLDASPPPRWRGGSTRIDSDELAGLPDRSGRLGSAAGLTSLLDDALGGDGLPGDATVLFLDGVPFHPATHPALRGQEWGGALLPRLGLSELTVALDGPDVEYGGAAGAHLAGTTRSSPPGGRDAEGGGSWAGDALWSSSELPSDPPPLTSIWADGAIRFELVPDTMGVFLAADAQRRQEPLPPRFPDGALSEALPPELGQPLTAPSVEEVTRFAGVARLDWWTTSSDRLSLRAMAAREERSYEGPGHPGLGYGARPTREGTDATVGLGFVSQRTPRFTLEFRGGLSASSRSFGSPGGSIPPTLLASARTPLGQPWPLAGEVSRFDVFFSPLAHYRIGGGTAKAGVQLAATRHESAPPTSPPSLFLGDDAASLLAGEGALLRVLEPASTFTRSRVAAFAEYEWEAGPDLRLSVGARVDYDAVPSGADAELAWFRASGLRNDSTPSSFLEGSGRAALRWDLAGDGATLLDASLSLSVGEVDPSLLHEAFARDGAARAERAVGPGLDWPEGSTLPAGASSLPTLSLLGPDVRPPRSARAAAGLTRRLGGGVALFLRGSYRRTDFLPRRRNLNLVLGPATRDSRGRPVFGELVKRGGLVVVEPGSHRRFPDFDDVWALDPDGWSESRSVTVGLGRQGAVLDLFASYTHSVVEDNWFGAAAGVAEAALVPALGEELLRWDEGRSDFDVPHRLVAGAALEAGGVSLSAVYRHASGLPFTPGYRRGVDVNGDGSGWNDPAFVPELDELGALAGLECLADHAGGFAPRNACRRPDRRSLDARFAVRLGGAVELTLDAYDLLESASGQVDEALLLVDPDAPLGGQGAASLPVEVNPDFGTVTFPESAGRILRLGLRIGG